MAQLPPGEVAPPRLPSTNYQHLFADRNLDAVRDNPRAFLGGYRFTNDAPTPAALLDLSVLLSDRQPMTFLCLVPRGDMYVVQILHRFMRYLELPGERPTGFNDRVMALLGDVRPAQFPVVEVPQTTFHLAATAAIRIPTHDAMIAAGPPPADSVAAELLGPFLEEGAAGTEMARPRHVQLIPSRYAINLVGGDGSHPRQVYLDLLNLMEQEGTLDDCRDVLTWLRTASTVRGGVGAQAGVPAVSLVFPGVHLPHSVYQYVTTKVHSDLPALRDGFQAGDRAGLAPAQQVAELMRAFGEGQAQRAGNAVGLDREPKQVQDVYRETYLLLLRHTRVEQTEELAPLWRRLENSAKAEQHGYPPGTRQRMHG